MTLSKRNEMQTTPVLLCINFENSVIRIAISPELTNKEVLFATKAKTYDSLTFANIINMFCIQKIKMTNGEIIESKLFTKEIQKKPPTSSELLMSFKDKDAIADIFLLKRTKERKYLENIKKCPLVALAKVSPQEHVVTYYKTSYQKGNQQFPLLLLFTSSEKAKAYANKEIRQTENFSPIVISVKTILCSLTEEEGICIDIDDKGIDGKNLSLAFLKNALV